MTNFYFLFARKLFEGSAKAHLRYHPCLKRDLKRANFKILTETYMSGVILTSIVFSVLSLIFTFSIVQALNFFPSSLTIFKIFPAAIAAIIILALTYLGMLRLPSIIARQRENSIERNLPFALMHMSTVAASGVAPATVFRLLTKADYGEVSVEASKIVNYIDGFGLDLSSAVHKAACNSPSKNFRELLTSINSTILSGGDLRNFLHAAAQNENQRYKSTVESLSDKLAIAAEIYSVILIAGPILLFVALVIMNMMWGTIGNMPISLAINLGTYFILPILNIVFIIFLEVAQ